MSTNPTMYTLIITLLIITSLSASEQERKKLHVLAIPGQNGLGSSPETIERLLGKDNVDVTAMPTPRGLDADLGQEHCQRLFANAAVAALKTKKPEKFIIFATSQGAATAINALSQGVQASAVVLESPLVSGNSAIHHTVKRMIFPLAAKLPFSYYWLPYVAKVLYPRYSPAGQQPIEACDNIPTELDIPIIIAHATEDPQISFDDACALYRRLTGDKIYFIQKNMQDHLNILDENDGNVIRQILGTHETGFTGKYTKVDLQQYQPLPVTFDEQYKKLIAKEHNHKRLASAAKTMGILGALAIIYKYGPKLYKRIAR